MAKTSQSKVSSNKNAQLIGIVVLVLIFSFAVGNYLSGKDDSILKQREKQEEVSQPTTDISFVTGTDSLAIGESTTVTVMLAGEPVQAVDIAINFDPEIITVSNIQNGTVYPDILREEISENQAVISAAVDPSNPNNLQTGELFSFTIEAVSAGDATLSFDPTLTITAKDGVNTLNQANELLLNVN